MADLISVVFNEGEPLDPKKLNDLRLNITNTYATASSLQNSTSSGTQTILMDTGQTPSVTVTVGKIGTVALPINAKFGSTIPTFVVSLGSTLAAGDSVSVGVTNTSTQTPKAVISYSAAPKGTTSKSFVINYIAFALA